MTPDQKKRHESFDSMRQAVVSYGKRMGTIEKEGDADPFKQAHLKAQRSRRELLYKRAGVNKIEDGTREAPQTITDDDAVGSLGRSGITDDVIIPPFDFITLCALFENSSALRQNIDAWTTNVHGFGWRFEPVLDFGSPEINNVIRDLLLRQNIEGEAEELRDLLDLTPEQIKEATPTIDDVEETKNLWSAVSTIEKGRLECFYDYINPLTTFTDVRTKTGTSRELIGNAAWEVLREKPDDVYSKIEQVYQIPFVNIRLLRSDRTPTKVKMIVRKDTVTFDEVEVERYFRRFIRMTGSVTTYYKEFGDPRVISRDTGDAFETLDEMKQQEGADAKTANELFHWTVHSPISPYGVPWWISALMPVLGGRASEEVNFLYFDNKAIPPMVLLVSGGRVSEQSVERIETYFNERIKGRANFHKIMIIEGLPATGTEMDPGADIEHSGKMRVELKPLMQEMQQDALFQNYEQNNIKKIGRVFRQPQLLTGDTADMNRSCYSEDTETLTENGWKLIDEIAPDEKVAAYDPDQHAVVFVVPSERHVHEVENEMLYHYENFHTDVLVTAEHKMLFRSRYERTEEESRWRQKEAKDLTLSRFRFRCAPDPTTWVGENLHPEFVVPRREDCVHLRKDGHQHETINIDDFMTFLGYWISEGSLLQTDDPMAKHWVLLSQKKPEPRARIQALLDVLPWNYSVQESVDGTTRWKISNKCLRDYLLKNCGGYSADKHIPAEFMHADRRHLAYLYGALMDGDGTEDSRENRTVRIYYTKSTVLADQVQEIAMLLGYRTRVRWGAGVWRVEHSDHRETCLNRDRHVSLVPYTGRVYCFAVPQYGFFVTRRNGKIAIQGNTAEVAKALAEEQIYQPARDEFDGVMDRHFLTNLRIHFWRFKTNAPVQRFPNDLIDNMKKSLDSGGITPNEARQFIADAFSIELPYRTEDWGNIPPKLALAAARTGSLAGAEPAAGNAADSMVEQRAVDQVGGVAGDVLAAGTSTMSDRHVHRYVVIREDGEVKIIVRPAEGPDGSHHTHDANLTKVPPQGSDVTVMTSEVNGHTHEIEFTMPVSKRRARAHGFASFIEMVRSEIAEAVDEAKDSFFDDEDLQSDGE